MVTAVNHSATALAVNLCFADLELHQGEAWVRVPRETPCPTQRSLLEADGNLTAAVPPIEGVAAGEYRFQFLDVAPVAR